MKCDFFSNYDDLMSFDIAVTCLVKVSTQAEQFASDFILGEKYQACLKSRATVQRGHDVADTKLEHVCTKDCGGHKICILDTWHRHGHTSAIKTFAARL